MFVHAPVSTWLIDNFGNKELFKSLKDIVIFAIGAVLVHYGYRQGVLRKVMNQKIIIGIILYTFFSVLITTVKMNEVDAELAGLIFNFRFLTIFIVVRILIETLSRKEITKFKDSALRVVMYGTFLVIGFGLLQVLVLPDDFLSNLGYNSNTIEPFDTVDENSSFVRVISTLRGANPLGVYLILGLSLVLTCSLDLRKKIKVESKSYSLLFVAGLAVLYFTYSRAAAVGAAVTLSLLVLVLLNTDYRKYIYIAGAILISVGLVAAFIFRDTDFVNYTILHSDQDSALTDSSNSERINGYKKGLEDVVDNPLGQGLGSAGPASAYNDKLDINNKDNNFRTDNINISENYYIQIAQEVGVIGLGVMLYIFFDIAKNMYLQRQNKVPAALFASFIGIGIAGMFMHAWTDETVAVVWWTLAGLWYKP